MRVLSAVFSLALLLTTANAVAVFEWIDTRTGVRASLYGGNNMVRPPFTGDFLGDVMVGGDFDGDGYEDLFVSSANGDGPDDLRGRASDVYVVFGRPRADVDSLYDLTQRADIVLYGAREDMLGHALAAGDVDADGYDDLLLAAPASDLSDSSRTGAGEIYILFGRPRDRFSSTYDFKTVAADVRIVGDGETAWFLGGWIFDYQGVRSSYPVRSLAVGDINGDGFDDVLVGSPEGSGWAQRGGGLVFAVFGRPRCEMPAVIDCDLATNAVHPDIVFAGVGDSASRLGFTILCADLDGDGIDDVLMNDLLGHGEDNQELTGGEIYGFFGRRDWDAVYDLRLDPFDFALEGRAGYTAGFRMTAGDLDGDQRQDLILTSPHPWPCCGLPDGRRHAGEHRVFFGRARQDWPRGWRDLIDFTDVLIVGAETTDALGGELGFDYPVSAGTGNWNGDGFDDILIGHGGADGPPYELRQAAGEAYVLLGRPRVEWPPLIDLATDPDIVIYGANGWDGPSPGTGAFGYDIFGFAVAMIDFDGSGLDDLFISAPYADGPANFRGEAGEVSIIFDRGPSQVPPNPRAHPGPPDIVLFPSAPNPFNPGTTLRFTAPIGSLVTLRIYDAVGRVVAQPLDNVRMTCADHELLWEARRDDGASLPSGVYFVKLIANSQTATRKIVLVR